jgi:hypothetical protein
VVRKDDVHRVHLHFLVAIVATDALRRRRRADAMTMMMARRARGVGGGDDSRNQKKAEQQRPWPRRPRHGSGGPLSLLLVMLFVWEERVCVCLFAVKARMEQQQRFGGARASRASASSRFARRRPF